MTNRTLIGSLALLLLNVGCGGEATESSGPHHSGSGGTASGGNSASGGSASGGNTNTTGGNGSGGNGSGGTGTGGATGGAANSCDELANQATTEFTQSFLETHRACNGDEDCARVAGISCVSPCGYMVNTDSVSAIDAAVEEACGAFEAQGCVARSLPCFAQPAPTCIDGTCGVVDESP